MTRFFDPELFSLRVPELLPETEVSIMRPTCEALPRQVGAQTKSKTWRPLFDGTSADVSRLMAVPSDSTLRYVRSLSA